LKLLLDQNLSFQLLEKLEDAYPQMPIEDKKIIKALLEGVIVKYQTRQMVGSLSG